MKTPIWRVVLAAAGFLAIQASAALAHDKVWRIGLFHVGLDHEPPSLPTLRRALHDLGYIEGKNLRFDWRNQGNEEEAHATARAFVRERVDLIVAFEDQVVRAAQAATTDIPIVFLHVADPIGSGYVRSLSHPGGNLTGFISYPDSIGKRLELFTEIVPSLRRVLALVDPDDPVTPRAVTRRAAAALGIELIEAAMSSPEQAQRVFATLQPGTADAVIVVSPNLLTKFPATIISLSGQAGLPFAAHRKEWVEHGALFSYAPDLAAVGPLAARYIDRILKGASPAELPVEQLSKLRLVINLKTATMLGLTVPPTLLGRADEVIE